MVEDEKQYYLLKVCTGVEDISIVPFRCKQSEVSEAAESLRDNFTMTMTLNQKELDLLQTETQRIKQHVQKVC